MENYQTHLREKINTIKGAGYLLFIHTGPGKPQSTELGNSKNSSNNNSAGGIPTCMRRSESRRGLRRDTPLSQFHCWGKRMLLGPNPFTDTLQTDG